MGKAVTLSGEDAQTLLPVFTRIADCLRQGNTAEAQQLCETWANICEQNARRVQKLNETLFRKWIPENLGDAAHTPGLVTRPTAQHTP